MANYSWVDLINGAPVFREVLRRSCSGLLLVRGLQAPYMQMRTRQLTLMTNKDGISGPAFLAGAVE